MILHTDTALWAWIFFVIHWELSLFAQTFFMHRYATHAMFQMSKKSEEFWYKFAGYTMGSSYLSPYAYALLQTMHHMHADKDGDPHPARAYRGLFGFIPLMKKTLFWYRKCRAREGTIVASYHKKHFPDHISLDERFHNWKWRMMWVLVYIAFYILFVPFGFVWLLLIGHFFMGPIHGIIINYMGHKVGYQNYEENDCDATNIPGISLIMQGENHHDNHHGDQHDPNFARRWWEFDPTYQIIRFLAWRRKIFLYPKMKKI